VEEAEGRPVSGRLIVAFIVVALLAASPEHACASFFVHQMYRVHGGPSQVYLCADQQVRLNVK
jgi:hypothetical protein